MKIVKDPVYGYIELDDIYWGLIDQPEFQRLRHIIQTGYRALYPSAHHNRFVHSLGVAYLGSIGFAFFKENVKDCFPSKPWERLRNTFILACLLHDVGHSPFSHTGERFYRDAVLPKTLGDLLKARISDRWFAEDVDKRGFGNPHEAMSALVGLDVCAYDQDHFRLGGDAGDDRAIDEEFFVRAIIGLKYEKQGCEAEDALIALLNGRFIDVDKLDYLMRDAFTTGFSGLMIDYERLLAGYTLVEDENKNLLPGYKRSALSVIENVVYARDLEKRWVQAHPAILYDGRIVDMIIAEYSQAMKELYKPDGVFVKEALVRTGVEAEDGVRAIRLLCDDDIVTYAKNCVPTPVSKQFLSRCDRLKPLWKTELEYANYAKRSIKDADALAALEEAAGLVAEELKARSMIAVNEDLLRALELEVQRIDGLETVDELCDEGALEADDTNAPLRRNKMQPLRFARMLKGFIEEESRKARKDLDFSFCIIDTKSFSPDFGIGNLEGDVLIELGDGSVARLNDEYGYMKHGDKACSQVKEVAGEKISVKEGKEAEKPTRFYMYTTAKNKLACSNMPKDFWDYARDHWQEELDKEN